MDPEKHKKYFGVSRMLAVSGFAVAASLALIIVIHQFDVPQIVRDTEGRLSVEPKSLWIVIFEHLATALFILGAWHTIEQLVVKREFKEELVTLGTDLEESVDEQLSSIKENLNEIKVNIAVARHDSIIGLAQSYYDPDNFGFQAMIRDTRDLTAVLSDGHSWIGRHAEAFRDRFYDSDKKTTFIFIHPESNLIPVLSQKINMQPDLYRQRIHGAIDELYRLNEGRNHLEIFGHSLINCHSVYIADKRAIFSPYFLSTHRRSPPIFEFKDTGGRSFFQKLSKDVELLKRESKPIEYNKLYDTAG